MGNAGAVVLVGLLLFGVSLMLGAMSRASLARRIGQEVRGYPPPSAPVDQARPDPIELLERLDALRRSGAITESEYLEQKARVLNSTD